ncbi:unnamed protein product [Urochloa humidicola]
MASSPSMEGFFTLFSARPKVRDECASDGSDAASIMSARHDEYPEEGTLYQDAKEGKTVQQDSPCLDHERLDRSPAVPILPCFILDSGAPSHVTGDKHPFLSTAFAPAVAPAGSSAAAAAYEARDGRVLTVAGVGTVTCDNFHVSNVLYVPGLQTGVILVSVQQLAERDYLVMFGSGRCFVRDRSSGKIIGKGRLHDDDGLYHLEFLKILPDATDATSQHSPTLLVERQNTSL